MRRTAPEGAEGSLEMLLDTITNAFGGILFLGLLIAVLLRMSGRASSTKHDHDLQRAEMIQLQLQLQERQYQLQETQNARRDQVALVNQLGGNNLLADYQELVKLKTERTALENAVNDQNQRILILKQSAQASKQVVQQSDAQRERLERELTTLQAEVSEAEKERSQESRFPRTRRSNKEELCVVMRYHRLYVESPPRPGELGRRYSLDDFLVVESDDESVTLTPRPTGGIPIGNPQSLELAFRDRLGSRAPTRWDIVICVWQDTFAEFQLVKNTMIVMGYNYRILPMSKGEKIYEGHVPDRQVQ